ncbi:MAG: acyl-CoA synthetases (AMP-forming)/AMP-acid ligases II [halophilic archaeon J07HB67]|jgi:O-succinylbenzoate-CoA ligase|nr:MAG: acyl-CoA synthetases (AMP-forming)/AMP-acid ligases II [halophilic archaeon J07HB67]
MRDWLAQRAGATPDAEALVAAASGTEWTYAELDTAVAEVAGSLAALGLAAGDRLGVFLDTRIEYVTLVHAAMRLGVRLVPVSSRLTEAELGPRLATADVTAVVCGDDTEQRAVEATTETEHTPAVPVVSLDEPQWERVTRLQTVESVPVDPHDWDRGEPLVSLFTSGSTGEPKLVVLRVGNVLSSVVTLGFRLGVDPDDRYLATLSQHHTGGLMPLYRAVVAGTSVVLRTGFEPGPAADDIRTYDVTGVSLVPTMLRRMLDARGTLADSLRVVLLGGAPAPAELIRRCRDYSVPVHPTYGMTEAASGITVATPQEAFDRPDTVGRPLVWTDLSVRDDDGTELPPGEVGEFVVDGPTVTTGYYDAPEQTAAAFGPHGLQTGDVGYRDEEGYVYVLNRKDDRILTGGENVDPGEVVGVLRDHPHVDDAAVVGVPDEEWGERVAALVVRSGSSTTATDLEAFTRERLAGFKLPRTIRFTDALPRTDSGSVERPEVRERLAADAATSIGDAETTDDTGETTHTDERDEADGGSREDGRAADETPATGEGDEPARDPAELLPEVERDDPADLGFETELETDTDDQSHDEH